MKRGINFIVFALIFGCLAAIIGPFLIPVSALEGLVTEKELADAGNRQRVLDTMAGQHHLVV